MLERECQNIPIPRATRVQGTLTDPSRCYCRVAGTVRNPGRKPLVLFCGWSQAARGCPGPLAQMFEEADKASLSPLGPSLGGQGQWCHCPSWKDRDRRVLSPGESFPLLSPPQKSLFPLQSITPFQRWEKKKEREENPNLVIRCLLQPIPLLGSDRGESLKGSSSTSRPRIKNNAL